MQKIAIKNIIFSILLKIKEIREFKNLTQADMVAKTGIPKRSYVDYENEKSDIPLERLRNIATILDVSVGELIGETKNAEKVIKINDNLNDNQNDNKPNMQERLSFEITTVDESENRYDPKRKQIPLIPIGAMAGFGTGTEQIMNYDVSNYVVPEFTELSVDFMIRVKGSSMYPKYSSGDLVACKKLFTQDIFFQWNKVYVLDTEQGALIKRVKKGIDDQHLLLTSENSNYDSFELHLSKVYAIALVVGVIRLE